MKASYKILIGIFLVGIFLVLGINPVFAGVLCDPCDGAAGCNAGLNCVEGVCQKPGIITFCPSTESWSLKSFLKPIINFLFYITLAVVPLFLIAGGVMFVKSGNNPEQVSKAKKIVIFALLGFVVVLSSQALTSGILGIFGGGPSGGTGGGGGGGGGGPDITPPSILNVQVIPFAGAPGTIFTVTANISDPSGVDPLTTIAHIQNPDEIDIDTVVLFDDGAHSDGGAGDGKYGNTLDSTLFPIATYFVDIAACDTIPNCGERENGTTFSTCVPTCVAIPGCLAVAPPNPATFHIAAGTCCGAGESCYACNAGFSWLGGACVVGLPSAFDWSHKVLAGALPIGGADWMSPVKDQAGCGSCWAFATLGSVEAKYNIEQSDATLDIDLSEQYLVSNCYAGGNCANGLPAFGFLVSNGTPTEACYGYLAANSACPAVCDDASPIGLWQIGSSTNVLPAPPADITDIQSALRNHGPLFSVVTLPIVPGAGVDANGCPVYTCGGGLKHGIVLTGYNDANNYWIVKNSWGVGAGPCNNGYLSLDYATCQPDCFVGLPLGAIYGSGVSSP